MRLQARVGDERAEARIERYDLAEGARAEDVREDGLVGRLFSPAGDGPSPGVLVLGGSEGGLSPFAERQAALLASRGHAALALAYFRGELFEPGGADGLPDTLKRVPLEYFGRAIRWLGERDSVDGGRLGVLGTSRGGEMALLLGATYPELGAVVSYVGSGVVTPAIDDGGIADEPAWTRGGEPVPYACFGGNGPSEISDDELRREEDEAGIPVEQTNGPVLLIAAGDDALWDSVRLSRIAMERLKGSERAFDNELAVYPKAGHAIGAPYVPTGDSTYRFGGMPEANARAINLLEQGSRDEPGGMGPAVLGDRCGGGAEGPTLELPGGRGRLAGALRLGAGDDLVGVGRGGPGPRALADPPRLPVLRRLRLLRLVLLALRGPEHRTERELRSNSELSRSILGTADLATKCGFCRVRDAVGPTF